MDRSDEFSLNDEDKFCFAKLALAKLLRSLLKYNGEMMSEEKIQFYESFVIDYSKHLCEVEYKHSAEPYLFYVMLTW
jgi:hypothetical protein